MERREGWGGEKGWEGETIEKKSLFMWGHKTRRYPDSRPNAIVNEHKKKVSRGKKKKGGGKEKRRL